MGGYKHDGSKGPKYTRWKERFLDGTQGRGDDDCMDACMEMDDWSMADAMADALMGKIMLDIDLRARSRFDRFRHHADGHGATVAASGGVGSRPRVPEKSAGRGSSVGDAAK